jgi:metal-dependent amidase/aminoacylase/carboxypeptidase family protein
MHESGINLRKTVIVYPKQAERGAVGANSMLAAGPFSTGMRRRMA